MDARTRALDLTDRLRGVVEMALVPHGIRALHELRPLSISAFSLTSRLRRLGLTPATILDVGANRGQFTAAAIFEWPEVVVHAFEPLPGDGAALEARFCGAANVIVHHVALGDSSGEATLYEHAYSLSSSLLPTTGAAKESMPWASESYRRTVPVRQLDDVLDVAALRRPVLLKVDVQGYEARVFAGADNTLAAVDAILVEQAFEPFYEGQEMYSDTETKLRDRGWRMERVISMRKERCIPVEVDCLYRPVTSQRLTLL